ncbi:ribosome-associated translation inhibitor RaiA [Balneolaceae bacterium YR4-1]|uniref:Ribosome-associated translation inhibitor RaiA n=1 Tax=Halalkalibaculum roseum TaxID=2709311 RepID=A0A6M1SLQ9_9BACT|nr:ribosome-associated translation inhibitor RaiA [Halalkalibaculum roseum]NGP76271.1 ribosome-associated translation inhibitor RaiA [Halalkalibaculum roseum]
MKTTFTARHFDASKELHTYAVDAVQKLDQFYDRIVTCDIILQPVPDDENPQQAELNVKVPQKLINAKEKASSYEKAINDVVDNVSRQLKKYKDKNLANY